MGRVRAVARTAVLTSASKTTRAERLRVGHVVRVRVWHGFCRAPSSGISPVVVRGGTSFACPETEPLQSRADPAKGGYISTMDSALYETDLPLPNRRQGKVRDIYELPAGADGKPRLLIVATDRLSAYDVVMPTAFPGKGRLLTSISMKWFRWIEKQPGLGLTHHVLSTSSADLPVSEADRKALDGSIMVCRRSKVVPIECVARGYLAGSGWKEYQKTGGVCGIKLPEGLKQCDKLAEPIFTPATKQDVGHDENISFEQACDIVGEKLMTRLRQATLDLYKQAHDYAKARGIIIADTKFEFGHAIDASGKVTDELLLIDEVLTPDSSRFWPLDKYKPGRDQESFDKQYVRNHLETLVSAGKWDKTPPGPEIPQTIVTNTIAKYQDAHDRLFA